MPIVRKREIENLEQLNDEEIEVFLKNLPAPQEKFEDLFDYLEIKLERETCGHSLRYAMQFMMENHLNFPKVTAWLNANGGGCDCKVLEEIVPEWRKAFD
ncbi:MAG: DUF2695 domain-containing protein [Pyrinomonadaceae bacterium]